MPETLRAGFVIARRDFIATVMSKTFLLFLLGPLFPVLLGVMFGGLGHRIDSTRPNREVAVVASHLDYLAIAGAARRLAPLADQRPFVALRHVLPDGDIMKQRQRLLADGKANYLGVLHGGLAEPRFIGGVEPDGRTVRQLKTFVDEARRMRFSPPVSGEPLQLTLTATSSGVQADARQLVATGGQVLLFMLTVLLAGMLLSQLIEEKSNKVIEILAAAVPIDAIFLGKLFAMLAVSLVGILVWGAAGAAAIAIWAGDGLSGLPPPAVGWPLFLVLIVVYFAMTYLLIGGVFLGIGGQASTAREVQTMSMPVTMAQVVIFGFATLAVGEPGGRVAIAAAVFPLSSPFAMIARAAEQEALWPHVAALAWQALWVALILKLAAALFRRSVLKSGPSRRWPWRRRRAA